MAEYKVPEIGEGITSVDLAALTVSVGDVIEAGAIVAEVETEKAATDLDCPIGGKVTAIHAKPGDAIDVGSVLLTIEAADGAAAAPAAPAPEAPAAAPAPAAKPAAPAEEENPAVARQKQLMAEYQAMRKAAEEEMRKMWDRMRRPQYPSGGQGYNPYYRQPQ